MAYDSKGTVNKVILIGRLGQDPELKYTPSGAAVVTLSVATNTQYKGQDGNYVENTEWNRVVAWRKLAEIVGQYAKKGSRVYVEGKLVTRSWDDQNGVKRYTTEIQAENIHMLDGRSESGGSSNSYEPPPPPDTHMAEPSVDEGDDLPF
jgi:single-strand DNA-binding protein